MNRNHLNFLIDFTSVLVMLGMVTTGLVIRFVLPPGSGSRRILWGLGRHDWGDIHFWLSVSVGVILLIHLALHWQWVCITVRRLCGRKSCEQSQPRRLTSNLVGVALIVALIAAFTAFVGFARQSVADVRGGEAHRNSAPSVMYPTTQESHAEADEQVVGERALRGSMTLAQAAETLGMSVDALRAHLGIPANEPATERMGRLARKYGFTMIQAREASSK